MKTKRKLEYQNQVTPVDLVAVLQAVDTDITQDCLAVIAMRAAERREPHDYFENGNKIFQYLRSLKGFE